MTVYLTISFTLIVWLYISFDFIMYNIYNIYNIYIYIYIIHLDKLEEVTKLNSSAIAEPWESLWRIQE